MRKHRQPADPFRRARMPAIPEAGYAKGEGRDIAKLENIIIDGLVTGYAQTCHTGECLPVTFFTKTI